MSTVPPPPIEPGSPRPASARGCARNALLGCGAVAALIAIALIATMVYLRRHPERMTDFLMKQVESNFASDVTPQEKEDLRAAYAAFRPSLVDGTASRGSLQDMRGILLSKGMRGAVSRQQVRDLTELFRRYARSEPVSSSSSGWTVRPSPPPVPTP